MTMGDGIGLAASVGSSALITASLLMKSTSRSIDNEGEMS